MSDSLLDTLHLLLEVTDKLDLAIENKEWGEAERLQADRQQLAEQAENATTPTNQGDSEKAASIISELKEKNSELSEKIQLNKQNLISQRKNHSKGQKMKKAYQVR